MQEITCTKNAPIFSSLSNVETDSQAEKKEISPPFLILRSIKMFVECKMWPNIHLWLFEKKKNLIAAINGLRVVQSDFLLQKCRNTRSQLFIYESILSTWYVVVSTFSSKITFR